MSDEIDLTKLNQKSLDAYLEFCVTSTSVKPKEVERVLRYGANPDHLTHQEQTGAYFSLFQRASYALHLHGSPQGNAGMFPDKLKKWDLLLDYGANPNRPNHPFSTHAPLYMLVISSNFELRSKYLFAQKLLNLGAIITPECLSLKSEEPPPLQQRVQQAGTPRTTATTTPTETFRPIEYIQLRYANAQSLHQSILDGKREATTLTAQDVITLANIDAHRDAFTPSAWRNHAHELQTLLTALPLRIAQEVLEHQPGLSDLLTPSTIVRQSDATIEATPLKRGRA